MHCKILIVDDEIDYLELMVKKLSVHFNPISARSYSDALDLLSQTTFPIMLIDVKMKSESGFDLVKEIRNNKKHEYAKIIFVSGMDDVEHVLSGYEAGADDYISKPVRMPELIAKINVNKKLYDTECKLRDLNLHLEKRVEEKSKELLTNYGKALMGAYTVNLIHDINNPLSLILGYLDILQKSKDSLKQEEFLERIYKASRKIRKTMMDIINTNKFFDNSEIKFFSPDQMIRDGIKLLEATSSNSTQTYVEFNTQKLNCSHDIEWSMDCFNQLFVILLNSIIIQATLISNKLRIIIETKNTQENELELVFKISLDPTGTPLVYEDSKAELHKISLDLCQKLVSLYGGSLTYPEKVKDQSVVTVKLKKWH